MKKLLLLILCTFFTALIAQAATSYSENFDSGVLGKEWRALKAEGGFIPDIVNGRLRLTDRSHDLSTALTLDYEFPTKDNNLTISFDYYAYGGCRDNDNYITVSYQAGKCGADGLTIILFDSSVGPTPRVGASGGSMGYANGNILMTDNQYQEQKGFEGGWLGIGLDEFGSYFANDEGRRNVNGSVFSSIEWDADEIPNTIAVRGDEKKGYRLLFSKNNISPDLARPLVKNSSGVWEGDNTSYHSGRYELNIDSTDSSHLYITLKRDGNAIIDRLDIETFVTNSQQSPRPAKFRLAFSSGAGGGCNNHEIDNIKIDGNATVYNPTSLPPSNPFTCDNNTSILFSGDIDESYSVPFIIDIPKNSVVQKNDITNFGHLNAAGYNTKDNFIYAFSYKNKEVVKIDANFSIVEHFIPENLLTAAGYNVGDPRYRGKVENGYYLGDVATDDSDRYYIAKLDYDAGYGSKILKKIYEIDLNTKQATPITLNYKSGQTKIKMADFAFNPLDNKLYIVNSNDNYLYRMDVLNAVANSVDVEKVGPLGLGSVNIYSPITYFDSAGNLYFIVTKSGVDDEIYKITNAKNKGKAVQIGQTKLASLSGDGARCAKAPMLDIPFLSVAPKISTTEGNSIDKTLSIAITLSEVAKKDITFDLQISNGTAKAGEDYVTTYTSKTSVTIPAGKLDKIIPITIKGDIKPESDETFKITISNIKEAASASPILISTGVIINDDFNTFTAYDTDTTLSYGEIKTKVVNKPFRLTLKAVSPSGGAALNADDMNNTQVKIVDSSVCSLPVTSLDKSGFIPFNILSGQNSTIHSFTVSKAMKSAKVQFYWIDEKGHERSACSADEFAVRPDHFTLSITPIAPDITLKAAKPFNIKIEAKDPFGATVVSYTGTNQAPYAIDFNDTKASSGCIVGTLTPDPINVSFVNGVAMINNAKYSEVGRVNFTVSDKKAFTYASVDKSDHGITDAHLLIGHGSANNVNFGVSKVIINWILRNGDLLNGYTYFNDLNSSLPDADMAALLELNARTVNFDGQTVKNFSNICYATNIQMGISYTFQGDSSQNYKLISEYQDMNNIYHPGVIPLSGNLSAPGGTFAGFAIDALFFRDGVGIKRVKFNIDRKTEVAYDPVTFDITNLNATLGGAITEVHKDSASEQILFLYARAHISSQSIAGNEAKVPVYYEVYCKNCNLNYYGLQNLQESKDSIYWYILNYVPSELDFTPITGAVPVSMPKSDMHATHGLVTQHTSNQKLYMRIDKTPSVSTVTYKPKPYLVYNPFNPLATTHKFTAKFSEAPNNWAGKGEEGLTVDTNIQERDNNILDW